MQLHFESKSQAQEYITCPECNASDNDISYHEITLSSTKGDIYVIRSSNGFSLESDTTGEDDFSMYRVLSSWLRCNRCAHEFKREDYETLISTYDYEKARQLLSEITVTPECQEKFAQIMSLLPENPTEF